VFGCRPIARQFLGRIAELYAERAKQFAQCFNFIEESRLRGEENAAHSGTLIGRVLAVAPEEVRRAERAHIRGQGIVFDVLLERAEQFFQLAGQAGAERRWVSWWVIQLQNLHLLLQG
jgi:hypothetical protein